MKDELLYFILGFLFFSIIRLIDVKPISKDKITNPNPTLISQDITIIPKFFNQTIEEGLYDALIYYDLYYPEIVYAQAQLETGHFKSNICLNYNNLFGLYNSRTKDYYKFNHWSESIKAYKSWIQKGYNSPEDYYNYLDNIPYARDTLYTWKLKQLVEINEKRRSIEACPSNSLFIYTPSISNWIW